jgi:hypothetical protein
MGRTTWITENPNESMPLFWDKEVNGVLYGKKGKVHTVKLKPVIVPKIQGYMNLRAINPNGELQVIEGESHSWTRNWYNFASSIMGINGNDATNFVAGNINLKDTGGTVRNAARMINSRDGSVESSSGYGYIAANADATRGIVVGTGTGAESVDSYVIGTAVAHGVGAGQLYYTQSPAPTSKSWVSGTRTFTHTLKRFFDNFSGGTITVKEIAQYASITLLGQTTETIALVARDLIADLAIADKSQALITYLYSLVYPSSGSPLRNWYNQIFSMLCMTNADGGTTFGDGYMCGKGTNGTTYSTSKPMIWTSMNATSGGGYNNNASNSNTFGAQAGTGNTAVSFDDYKLATLIAHGTSSGQLSYGLCENPLKIWASPIMTIRHARTITNNSGGSITVKEIGLACEAGYWATYWLSLRDVISDIAMANGESLRPIHDFQVTYP